MGSSTPSAKKRERGPCTKVVRGAGICHEED